MSRTVAGTLLGILVAFLFASSAFLQQRAARETQHGDQPGELHAFAVMAQLLRDRGWLAGWGVNLCGFGAQAVALRVGSLATVQPLLATQLLFALPLSSLERRTWPRARDWLAGLSLCAGLAVLLVVVDARPLAGSPDRGRIVLAALAALAFIAVVVPVSARIAPGAVVLAAGTSAGLCFAMTAVFIKLTTDDLLDHGVAYTATDWVGYALAASTGTGLVLGQVAFANGPLPWAVATREVANPIAGYAIGVLAFPVSFPDGNGPLVGLVVAVVLVLLGAVSLAHSPSVGVWLRGPEHPPGDAEEVRA